MKMILHALALAIIAATVLALLLGLLVWRQSGLKVYSLHNNLAPAANRGDLILVAPGKVPRPGDIVNFADPTHPRGVISQKFHDQNADNYAGVAIKAIPLAGYALEWLHHPAALALTVYTPAIVIITNEVRRLSFAKHGSWRSFGAPVTT